MLYQVLEREQTFDILELQTGNLVLKDLDQGEAKDLCRNLNLGNCGFDGWTPNFFMENFHVHF